MAETEISHVDGANGKLIYRGGHFIEDIVERSFEEIAFLLWNGIFPSDEQLRQIKSALVLRQTLSDATRASLHWLRPDVDPMDALRVGLSAFGAREGCPIPTLGIAQEVTAVMPVILSFFLRGRRGLKPVEPNVDLGFSENLLFMLDGEHPSSERVEWLERYLAVMADHDLSPSTFTAQVVASTGSDLYSSIIAALGALKGSHHGGAVAAAFQMLEPLKDPTDARSFVRRILDDGRRLSGFGHREYRQYDPRARILREVCRSANPHYFHVAEAFEEAALEELRQRHPARNLLTNVDFYAGGVLSGIGIPRDAFAAIFGVARSVGWSAHVLEYLARGGRIVSPASKWIGPNQAPSA